MSVRAQCVVHRHGQLLMVRQRETGCEYWCLPGGRVEEGETPSEAALRELEEECGVRGEIVRELQRVVDPFYQRSITFEVEIGPQEPHMADESGYPNARAVLTGMSWLSLREIPERDRAFLFAAGLLGCAGFAEEVEAWGDDLSWPVGQLGGER
jgi:ADP-ribose pyrophosphatase YjhB (NUDIX family)